MVERARARARVEGAVASSFSWTDSSMAWDRLCCRSETSMSGVDCQCGWDAAEDKADRATSRWGGWQDGRPSIDSTRSCD